MFNRLKSKIAKWLCIDKLLKMSANNLVLHKNQEEIENLREERTHTLSKRVDKLVNIIRDLNKDHGELANVVMLKSDLKAIEERILKNVQAVQAIDMDFHNTGKIIIMQRVGKEDRVSIIDVPPNTTVKEYRHNVEMLQRMYKADLRFVDGPRNIDFDDLRISPRTRY